MLLGLITLLCFPFLSSDVFLDNRTAELVLPIGSTQMVFFPFVLTACSIAILTGIAATANSVRNRTTGVGDRPLTTIFLKLLSLREREVYEHLLSGSRNKDIARVLTISESTVKKHVRNILQKTATKSRLELIRKVESTSATGTWNSAGTEIEPDVSANTPEVHFSEKDKSTIFKTRNSIVELKNMNTRMKLVIVCGALLIAGTATVLILHFSSRNRNDIENMVWHTEELIHASEEYENEDGFWTVSTPEQEGYIRTAVLTHLELAIRTGADALLVVRGNRIVCEWYSDRYQSPMGAMSSTKSIAGLLCGIMEDRGLLDIDNPVSKFLPEWTGGFRDQVNIRHLLSMSSGLLKKDTGESVGYVSEKNAHVMGLSPDVGPGTRWSYSNEGVQLLSPLMEAVAGMNLNVFADEHLFTPIGMERTSFYAGGSDGAAWTYADMQTSPRDFARVGWLVMNGGVWNGKPIVSAEYLEEMLAPQATADFYGLLWWLHDTLDLHGYGTEGYLDTDMYIFPRDELIVVRMQAPREQFTGENESGNYQELAWRLFKAFTNPDKNKNVDFVIRILTKLLQPERDTQETRQEAATDAQEPDETRFETDLEIAIEDSRNGKSHEVINRLQPYLDQAIGNLAKRTQAQLLIVQQYVRLHETKQAKKLYNLISVEGLSQLPTWYQDYFLELESVLQ
jgi:CubicO group peptidase (beta-lactamase class C family)/DNA-binding CsgD family transcriptional regulator